MGLSLTWVHCTAWWTPITNAVEFPVHLLETLSSGSLFQGNEILFISDDRKPPVYVSAELDSVC